MESSVSDFLKYVLGLDKTILVSFGFVIWVVVRLRWTATAMVLRRDARLREFVEMWEKASGGRDALLTERVFELGFGFRLDHPLIVAAMKLPSPTRVLVALNDARGVVIADPDSGELCWASPRSSFWVKAKLYMGLPLYVVFAVLALAMLSAAPQRFEEILSDFFVPWCIVTLSLFVVCANCITMSAAAAQTERLVTYLQSVGKPLRFVSTIAADPPSPPLDNLATREKKGRFTQRGVGVLRKHGERQQHP